MIGPPQPRFSLSSFVIIRQLHQERLLEAGGLAALLKLETIKPAIFDQATRARLLQNQLNRFVQARAERFKCGEPLDQLEYHPES